jgi:hypothetical protein
MTYSIGQLIIATIAWEGMPRQRRARIASVPDDDHYLVNVWSYQTNTWYTNEILIDASAITPMSILVDW